MYRTFNSCFLTSNLKDHFSNTLLDSYHERIMAFSEGNKCFCLGYCLDIWAFLEYNNQRRFWPWVTGWLCNTAAFSGGLGQGYREKNRPRATAVKVDRDEPVWRENKRRRSPASLDFKDETPSLCRWLVLPSFLPSVIVDLLLSLWS